MSPFRLLRVCACFAILLAASFNLAAPLLNEQASSSSGAPRIQLQVAKEAIKLTLPLMKHPVGKPQSARVEVELLNL
jgi:hypothetical protein